MVVSPSPRQDPRISVNELAAFMVSTDTGRMGIIRRAKFPQNPPIIRYKDVRAPVISYLTDRGRKVQGLVSAERMFTQRASDSSQGPLRQDDARQSIEVLRAIQGMSNQIGGMNFTAAPADQPKLEISTVIVSVRLDMLVYGATRGLDQIGGAILRMTQDDAETDSARAKRREMGLYVATVARMHLERNLRPALPIANKLCMSIDVRHGEAFAAPASNVRRVTDLENACRFIAAMWPTVQ